MSKACDVCGKSASVGNQVETRGKAKYLGGVGTKITGITKRRFTQICKPLRLLCHLAKSKPCVFAFSAFAAVEFARLLRTSHLRFQPSLAPPILGAHDDA